MPSFSVGDDDDDDDIFFVFSVLVAVVVVVILSVPPVYQKFTTWKLHYFPPVPTHSVPNSLLTFEYTLKVVIELASYMDSG